MIRGPAHVLLGALGIALPALLLTFWMVSARLRLEGIESGDVEQAPVATASVSHEGYCSTQLRQVLRRVLQSCGLLSGGQVRGCQPLEAKKVATLAGDDFNSIFLPLEKRAAIIQFDQSSARLDDDAISLLDQTFADQKGASYFFVVSRASPEGSVVYNRKLSRSRAESVMSHLRETFQDPDLDQEVGLLWLGEEYAQLEPDFCEWSRSKDDSRCSPAHINRSAFVAWVDCRL